MQKNDMELNKKCGERLTECRNAAGLSQEKLGKRVHLSKQQIWNIENGKRALTPSNAILIGRELAVDPDYLLCTPGHDVESFEKFCNDNFDAKRPVKAQIIYDLIKENPDCVKIAWCFNGDGEQNEWGWTIDVLTKTKFEQNPYRAIHLGVADLIRLFDELTDFMRYQLFKQPTYPHLDFFDFAFGGEIGGGFSLKEYQAEADRKRTATITKIIKPEPEEAELTVYKANENPQAAETMVNEVCGNINELHDGFESAEAFEQAMKRADDRIKEAEQNGEPIKEIAIHNKSGGGKTIVVKNKRGRRKED